MSQLRILVTGCKGRMGQAVIRAVEDHPDCVLGEAVDVGDSLEAGLALDPKAAPDQLETLARCGEARVALAADLSDAQARWTAARSAARKLPSIMFPALLHVAAADTAEQPRTPLSKRWRMFVAALTRRL